MKYRFFRFVILIIFISLLTGCFKKTKKPDEVASYFDGEHDLITKSRSEIRLPIPYKKLEAFIGDDFIPVFFIQSNMDNDIDEELCIAYKMNSNSNIDIMIFDVFYRDTIKKKYKFSTEISNEESYIMQSHNLFVEDDIGIVIEGKSTEYRNIFYILEYISDEYELIAEFSGDFSVIVDYEEQESQKGKYYRLKEVATIDSSFSSTNATIRQRKVYNWNYSKNEFKLVETSQILSSGSSLVDRSVFASEDNFLNYINGFWYPSKYSKMIGEYDLAGKDFNINNIEFILFRTSPKEINIKNDDHISNYSILSMNRLWGQKPGLRFKIRGISKSSSYSYKKIEIFLLDPEKIKVSGPKRYDNVTYLRLPKPFIEYVNESNEEILENKKNNIYNFLMDNFMAEGGIEFNSATQKEFTLKNGKTIEIGFYKLTDDKNGMVISFLSNEKSMILDYNNYIIKLSDDAHSFSLMPVSMGIQGIKILDVRMVVFYKIRNEE